MLVKGVIDEDFVNYKKVSMFVMCHSCTFKCDRECGERVCQNSTLANSPDIEIGVKELVVRYLQNPITEAIVFGGLEPVDDFYNVLKVISDIRNKYHNKDDVVIYTGYTEDEVAALKTQDGVPYIDILKSLSPVVIKYGRFKTDRTFRYDEVLGVKLASDNQYAVRYE